MARLTPQEIRDRDFKQSALGFSREQVHQFLDEIAGELELLIRESNAIHVENKEARLTLKTYLNVEDSLKETLLLAQKTGRETLTSAQNEADNILRKAQTEKDALLFSAKEDLAVIQNQIRKLQAERSAMLIRLKTILQTNLNLLDTEFGESNLNGQFELKGTDDERIVDFSQNDLIIDDLPEARESPDITIEDAEDFDS